MAKSIVGTVSSISGDKTIVITTKWRRTHPLYKKQYTVHSKYMAHDEKNQCNVGDKVVIEESRPLSARKRYSLKEIVEKAVLTDKDLEVISKDETAEEKAKKADKADEEKA